MSTSARAVDRADQDVRGVTGPSGPPSPVGDRTATGQVRDKSAARYTRNG